ncbi:MAG: Smr/MutS family protein [Hyphomicrobiales bacterium]
MKTDRAGPIKPAGRPDTLSDFGLWLEVAKTVKPLDRAHHGPMAARNIAAKPRSSLPGGKRADHPRPRPFLPGKSPSPTAHSPSPPALLPLSGLDRRTRQRLTRGQIAIDARLDLHGETAQTARMKLEAFLSQAFEDGRKTVLVITGKGRTRQRPDGPEIYARSADRGRLRGFLPQWLEEPSLRRLVSGYRPAHPRHGGGGAFYVRLCRSAMARHPRRPIHLSR